MFGILVVSILIPLVCVISIPIIFIVSGRSVWYSKHRKKTYKSASSIPDNSTIQGTQSYLDSIRKDQAHQDEVFSLHRQAINEYYSWCSEQRSLYLSHSDQYKDMDYQSFCIYLESQKDIMVRKLMGDYLFDEYQRIMSGQQLEDMEVRP